MNNLIVNRWSRLAYNIDDAIGPRRLWCSSIKKLDPNIVSVTMASNYLDTIIEFKSEEHKTWFLLRWS